MGRSAGAVVLVNMASAALVSLSCGLPLPQGSPAPAGDDYQVMGTQPYTRQVKGSCTLHVWPGDDVPDGDPWHVWLALPRNTMTQELLVISEFSVPPTDTFTDPEHGNTIAHWDIGNRRDLDLAFDFTLQVNNVLTTVDPGAVGEYDTSSAEYQRYTRSERQTAITDGIRTIAGEIRSVCEDPDNPYLLARSAYKWIIDNMAYYEPVEREPDVEHVLQDTIEHNGKTYYRGDCGSYTMLYNSVLRASGIPARAVVGGFSIDTDQWHVWSEILIPGYGWIPVDTSASDVFVYDEGAELNVLGEKHLGGAPWASDEWFFFGNVDPLRFVMSIGTDIAIQPAVEWDLTPYGATWMYHQGRAGIMQAAIVHPAFQADGHIIFEETDR